MNLLLIAQLLWLAPQLLTFDSHARETAYVGRADCRGCHQQIYATFARTGMGRALSAMSPDNVVEDFSEFNELVHPRSGTRYRMVERDDRYFQRQFRIGPDGTESLVDERELIYAVGSNNHGRGYFTREGGGLFQTPVCWDPTTAQWIFCPGFESSNDHFSREIGHTCVFCHNGRMVREEGQRNHYREPVPQGIGCERCHGPGQLHVAAYEGGKPTRRGKSYDPTIVHPGRLPQPQRIQVCFQCHLGDATATERVRRYGRELEEFRPGMTLTDFMVPFRYAVPTEAAFGIASQADRLLLSRCYLESEGKLECLTCHDPHVTVYRNDRPADFFNARCGECHETRSCPSADQDCVSCHMRRAEPADRRYATFTDHWIRRSPATTPQKPRTDFEMQPVFPESYGRLSPGEQAYARARAYFRRALVEPQRARPFLWSRAEEGFRQAIALEFDNREARFFLGKVMMFTGRWELARAELARAVQHDPTYEDAVFALGQSLAALGDHEGALERFNQMLERDPDNPMALADRGRSAWSLGRLDEAARAYRRAVDQQPWNAELHLNLANVLASQGKYEAATETAAEALRLDPDRLRSWEFYARAAEHAGRPEAVDRARYQIARLRKRPDRTMRFDVSLADPDKRQLHVQGVLPRGDLTSLVLRFDDRLRSLRASSGERALPVTVCGREGGARRIDLRGAGDSFQLDYVIDAEGGMLFPAADLPAAPAIVRFSLPDDWVVSAPGDRGPEGFRVPRGGLGRIDLSPIPSKDR